MKILHPLSGGIDSVSVLHQILAAGHEVTTLHVDLCYRNNVRWKAERIAVENVLQWCRAQGYKINHIDGGSTALSGRWWDIEVIAMHTGNNLRILKDIEAVTESTSLDDIATNGWKIRNANRRAIINIIAGRPIKWLRPNGNKHKRQAIAEMPQELLALTSSCRSPEEITVNGNTTYKPCNVCHACKSINGGNNGTIKSKHFASEQSGESDSFDCSPGVCTSESSGNTRL
jgi:7-cyano-7-deazaguanine synthase in queuosine biosynthesis